MYQTEEFMGSGYTVENHRPGEQVPKSGIYKVSHRGHYHDHEVTCVSGEQFPRCHQCGDMVRFSLLIAAHDVRRHTHFYGGEDTRLNSAA
jgi:hypothetical protein